MGVFKTVWKNRRHFKLQIFGVTVFFVVAIFLINLLSIKLSYNGKVNEYMSETVQYTSSFQMSLSGAKGTIDNIFVDSTKTQCFVLATIKNTSSIAMDASQYQMFVTNTTSDGVADGTPEEQLTGEIYMFGTSGRIGLYMRSDIPFANKMKKITLRSYKKFTVNTSPYFETTPSDAEYDQCHIFLNPGGKSGRTVDFLEKHVPGTDFNLGVIYRQLNTSKEYKALRESLTKCQDDILTVYSKMFEYQERLTNTYNLQIPSSPSWSKGDSFETVEIYDADGNVTDSYRKFVPNVVLPGGTDYDWYPGNVDDGYYYLVPDSANMSLREYLIKLSNEKKSDIESIDFKWYYTDGSEVVFSDVFVTNYEKEMKATMEGYKQLFNDYLNLKKKYQVEYLPGLLKLEFESETIGQSYTVNRNENVLLVY